MQAQRCYEVCGVLSFSRACRSLLRNENPPSKEWSELHDIALRCIESHRHIHAYIHGNKSDYMVSHLHTYIAYTTPCEPYAALHAIKTLCNAQHNATHHATQRSATQRAPMQRNARQRDTRDTTQRIADDNFVSSLARATEHALQMAACARTREPEYSLASCCKTSLDF